MGAYKYDWDYFFGEMNLTVYILKPINMIMKKYDYEFELFYYVGKLVGKKVNKRDNHLKTGQ